MTLRIDSPLFGDTASGSIRSVGTFRQTPTGTFLSTEAVGNHTSVAATATIRACFASAKTAYSAIFPYWEFECGRYRFIRTPKWPAFWTQWLIDNPACLL